MTGPAPWRQGSWDWRAAGNFIGGGSGTGLLLFAAAASFGGLPFAPLGLLALALIAGGLGLVWLEIGKPWRFLHVYFHLQTSWMTREAIVALPLFAAGLAAAWLGDPATALVAGLLGLGFLYCQGKILHASKGIPAWRQPLVVPLIMATGLTEGAGLLLVALPFLGTAARWPAIVFLVLLVLRLVAWKAYHAQLAVAGAPKESLAALARTGRALTILGFALPAIGAAVALWGGPIAQLFGLAAGALGAAGGWLLKFDLVTRAAHNQGFAIRRSPVRGAGAGGPAIRPGWR